MPSPASLLFRGARLVDGTGAPSRLADVRVVSDTIVEVGGAGALSGGSSGTTVIDVSGQVLAPGFIDVHTHDDRYVLATPGAPAKVSQGVTTVVTGNCGLSLAPLYDVDPLAPLDLLGERGEFRYPSFASYIAALDGRPAAVNVAPMVGHTTLRVGCMAGLADDLARRATEHEIERMRQRCAEAIDAGAFGVSIGTFYPPARSATADEIVRVCAPLTRSGGVLTTHLRDEGDNIDAAMKEAFEIGRRLDVPLVLSHHKVAGACNHGRSIETLGLIDTVARSQSVSFDVYPYTASSTMLSAERLRSARRTLVSWSRPHPELAGLAFEDAARRLGLEGDAAIAALQPAGAIYFLMNEDDVDRIIAHPGSMIGSDGLPHDQRPHPRLWGAFPRVLSHYVRERRLLSLEQAIHKMTGLGARRFGLRDRGFVQPGLRADLVLFDPERIRDLADFDSPTRATAGIGGVWVNGTQVWSERGPTGATPGRALRRAAA